MLPSEFDALAANYGLEKIKTFGDTYVLAAGIPSVVPNHADAVAQLALDIQVREGAERRGGGGGWVFRKGVL